MKKRTKQANKKELISWKYKENEIYLHPISGEISVKKRNSCILSIGKLIKIYNKFRDKLLPGMAGRSLRAMHRTADYKHGKALKSCRTEFFHICECGYSFFKLLSLLLPLINMTACHKKT
jgi:hypothetical protein